MTCRRCGCPVMYQVSRGDLEDYYWHDCEKPGCYHDHCAEPDLRINAHESPDCCQPSVDEWELSQTKEMQ